jgi:hypothetical protein
MARISPEDLKIIVKGAIQMAQQDEAVVAAEEGLIRKLIEASRLDPAEFADLKSPIKEDITGLCQQLSGERAKKIFLLTLFAVANVDEDFDAAEKQLMDDLSQQLGVGKIKQDPHTIEACTQEVIRLLAEN